MGERKGQNKYYPPDYDPKKGGLNKWQGTHALRERARKLHLGILIIRFEMPFNVWCEGCENHVGMGVRYNAEKSKVGMYYTTPLYEFKMKCHLCTNYFIIRTDPKNFDYELVEGLRRQERRWNMAENGQIAAGDREKNKKLATDAMFKLEHGEEDAAKSKALNPAMKKLERFQERWKDDFARNQEMRCIFRTHKKATAEIVKQDDALLKKSSLDIQLLPETSDDKRLASMISLYKTVKTSDQQQEDAISRLDNESMFDRPGTSKGRSMTDSLLRGSLKRKQILDNLGLNVKSSIVREKMKKLDNDKPLTNIIVRRKSTCQKADESDSKKHCASVEKDMSVKAFAKNVLSLASLCAAYDTSSGEDDSGI